MEHTHTDIQTAAMMFGAIADAGCVPLARVPDRPARLHQDGARLRRDGDRRADGDGRGRGQVDRRGDQVPPARQPLGRRRPARAELRRDRREVLPPRPTTRSSSIIQTEHIEAVEIADEIYAVPGIDAVFVGPNDLADLAPQARRHPAQQATDGRDAYPHPRGRQAQQGLPCGLHVQTAADAQRRIAEGWQFIAVASELKMMLEGASVHRQTDQRGKADGVAGQLLSDHEPRKVGSPCS